MLECEIIDKYVHPHLKSLYVFPLLSHPRAATPVPLSPPPKFPLCAAQEELVLAALRIEALQVAKSISQCPSLSTVTPQVLR